jgi:transcriptional regulator with XRE-family HTH domain
VATSPYDPRHEELVRRIREARIEARLTQVDVAERLKLPQSVISRLEAGQRKVSAIELFDLAEMFGVAMEDLVPARGGKGRRR